MKRSTCGVQAKTRRYFCLFELKKKNIQSEKGAYILWLHRSAAQSLRNEKISTYTNVFVCACNVDATAE